MGCCAFHHIPKDVGCDDSNWRIRLLCVSLKILLCTSSPILTIHYSGLNVTALVMIFLWVPETKQRTLEELDYIFAVPTRVHMKYQVTKALPYWFKRYVFRQKVTLEPLYKFDHLATGDEVVAASRKQSVVSEHVKA